MFHIDLYLVEHCLDVAHKCDSFLPKSAENSGEIICQIWPLEKLLVQGVSITYSTTVEHDSNLSWYLLMVHSVMWDVPHLFTLRGCFVNRDPLCITTGYDVLHEAVVILSKLVITCQSSFKLH